MALVLCSQGLLLGLKMKKNDKDIKGSLTRSISYVNKNYEPTAILDFATLTGAVLIALGNRASGVMGNDVSLMKEVKQASKITSEKVWELPLWDEYSREIKGKYADIKNIGEGRLAGTFAAGAFLKKFIEQIHFILMASFLAISEQI